MTKDTDNYDNIQMIQALNRMLLNEAHQLITQGLPLDNKVPLGKEPDAKDQVGIKNISIGERERFAERNEKLHLYRRIWGEKIPLSDVLAIIADTELKIEKHRPSIAPQNNTNPVLDEKDIALVKHYLGRHIESLDHPS